MSEVPPSLRPLSPEEHALVETARSTIDACTDAGPGEDGIHTMGAAVRAADGRVCRSVLIEDLLPLATAWTFGDRFTLA